MVAKLQSYEESDPSVASKLQFWREALAAAEYERANWKADQNAACMAEGVGAEVIAAEVDVGVAVSGNVMVEEVEIQDEEAELARIEDELEKGPVFEEDEVVMIEDDVEEDKEDMEGIDIEATEAFWKMMNEIPDEVVDKRTVTIVNKDSDDEVDMDVEVKEKDYEAMWRAKDDAARERMGEEEWAKKEERMKRTHMYQCRERARKYFEQ